LRHLSVVENDLKTDGACSIIENASKLESLDLSKNYISSEAGAYVETLLSTS
jgi:hypothetical protein